MRLDVSKSIAALPRCFTLGEARVHLAQLKAMATDDGVNNVYMPPIDALLA